MLEIHDAQLARRDEAIPGLAAALDAECIAGWLREQGCVVDQITSSYVRYKPHTSCLVAYQASVAGERTELHVKAFGKIGAAKIAKQAQSGVSPVFPARASLQWADQRLVMHFFPHDANLPVLKRLAHQPLREKLLQHVLPQHQLLWSADFRRLTYKPERRFVGRLTADDGATAVIRCYDPISFTAAYESSKHISSRHPLTTPRRLGRSHRHNVVVYEWLPGTPLNSLLSDDAMASAAAHATGAALAQLHAQDCKRVATLSPQDMAARLRGVAHDLSLLLPEIGDQAVLSAHKISDFLAAGCVDDMQLVHNDFDATQVLVDDERVAIIDIDKVAYAEPAVDLGTFLARLQWSRDGLSVPLSRIDLIRQELINGYNTVAVSPPSARRVRLHEAAALLLLAPLPFRYRVSDWAPRATQLVRAAAEVAAACGSVPAATTATTAAAATAPPYNHSRLPSRRGRVSVEDEFRVSSDLAMPFLAAALEPDTAETLLHRNLTEFVDRYGRFELRRIRVLRHKPGRRCLVAYDVRLEQQHTDGPLTTLLGKVRARRLDRRTYELQRFLWDNGFDDRSVDLVSVPQPLGVVPELQMWFQQHIAGQSVTARLTQDGSVDLLRRVAGGLHKLHACDVVTDRSHSLHDELEILARRLADAAEMLPAEGRRLAAIMERCRQVAGNINPSTATGIHRDFYPDQVLVSGDRLYLLDLDLFCRGDATLDVGNFQAHLWEYALRNLQSANALSHAETAFISAYAQLAKQDVAQRIEVMAWLSLARHIYISLTRPHRQHTTQRLIEFCEQHLASSERPAFTTSARL